MSGHPQRVKGEWAADAACMFLIGNTGNFCIDGSDAEGFLLFFYFTWPILIIFWMHLGLGRLRDAEWVRAYGSAGGVSWLFKDSVAMVLWPVLLKWIHSRKSQS